MDGAGSFYFGVNKKGVWAFYFKIVQSTYNLRLLYHCKSNLGVGSVCKTCFANTKFLEDVTAYKLENREKEYLSNKIA